MNYNIVASTNEMTVVAEYTPALRPKEQRYQSEEALEKDFIARLKEQGYEYLSIGNEKDFIDNLRLQLEK